MARRCREMNEFIVFNICSLYHLDKNENDVDLCRMLRRGKGEGIKHPCLQLLIIRVSR